MKIKPYVLLLMFSLTLTTASSRQVADNEFISKLIHKADRDQKVSFDKSLQGIAKVSLNTDVYSKFITKVHTSIEQAADLNEIARKINPSDSTLTGQSYTTFVQKTAIDVFTSEATDEENKARIKSVITNLADKKLNDSGNVIGSLIKGFVGSNPVLNLATNVVSGIATFFKAKKDKIKNTEVIVSMRESISAAKLKEFKNKISVYSDFYDQALSLNIQFGKELDNLLSDASAYDLAAQAAIADLKKYGTEEIKIDVSNLSALQETFKYDFETLYFETYDHRLSVLLAKAKKVDSIYTLTTQLDAKAQTIIKAYVGGVDTLAKDFLKKIKNSQKEKVSLTSANSKLNFESFKAESTTTSITFSDYKSAFEPVNVNLSSSNLTCCGGFNWQTMLMIILANGILTVVLIFLFKKANSKEKYLVR